MATGGHSVALSWQASSSDVDGYNVYRSGALSGPFSKLNSSPDDGTSYTDSTVQSGGTYYYVTTAVGTDGVESAYSNKVKAVIP
jgi:fibronectin type 3 domain-containing protein